MKPTILIFADFPNWAYYEIMEFVKTNLSVDFDFYYDFLIYNTNKKSKHPIKRLKGYLDEMKYSKTRKDNSYDIVLYLAFYFDEQMKIKWKAKKTIKGIYTDGFPPSNANYDGNVNGFIEKYFKDTDAVVCGSKKIMEFYSPYFPKTYYANMILDENLYTRKTPENNKESFIIGWTGNPKRDFKGYYSHIIPALKKLKVKYPNIELKSRFSGPIATLPMFYEDVDLVVIASDADAGPSLFAEASLMDVPCVSTNIGWPSEVIRDGINGYIVNKDVNEIAGKIESLYLDSKLLKKMSNRIREDFKTVFNKQDMTNRWKTMFNEVLQ